MGDTVKITDLKCPGCGSALKMPAEGAKKVQCEYCGNEYIIDAGQEAPGARRAPQWDPAAGQGMPGGRRIPRWEPAPQEGKSESVSKGSIVGSIIGVLCLFVLVGVRAYWRAQDREAARQAAQREVVESMAASINTYNPYTTDKEEEGQEALSGILEQMVVTVFGKEADSVTQEELDQIQWIADQSDFDNMYIGYSFENPLENPDAQLEWLTFPSGSDRGYSGLYMFGGLKKLDIKGSLSQCDLQGLSLESLSASFSSLADAARALDDPATIRQLSLGSSVKSLERLDLFPNLESLTIDADDMSDVNEVVALGQLKSLTLEDADAISDFAVFAAMGNLEELYIESENLKSLDFLKRMPQLKSLGLSDGELLSLDGIEALEGLERLSVTDCGELKSMDAVATLTGLTELSLEKPYNCEEPSLAGLTGLKRLTLDNFDSCAFLSKLTELEELTLRSCDMPSNIDLSGLTQLKRLTCTTFYQDRSLAFVKNISSLEYLNLGGMVTYEDISGIFALPNIRELKLSGMECEIDFDRVGDNSSLESLEMAGVRLYENVKVYSSGGMTSVYYDDVFLAEHLDFFEHFPSLRKLDVADNELKDLEFAGSLVNLEEIDFSENYVTDMHVLASIPSLRLVNCTGNPISNLRVLDENHVHVINE